MEKNLKKKKFKGKNVQRKGNYFKRARGEEIIKFLVDKNLTLVPEYFNPEYRIFFLHFSRAINVISRFM